MYHDLTKGEHFPFPSFICSAYDGRKSAPAVLQYCRHFDRRPGAGKRCVGGSWFCLYTDDFSYVYLSGVKFRFRGAVFYLQGQRG